MTLPLHYVDPSDVIFKFSCIKLRQPIGELYVGALPFKILCAIADFDVRHVLQDDRELDTYLGIQRPLNKRRVAEIQEYVNFADASFPTAIIIAVDERCAEFDSTTSSMTLRNVRDEAEPVLARQIARVIDGQHRIAGLFKCRQEVFECPVTIVVGADISDQAQMFARVNLSQTPVSRSLVYDLFELAKTRSPQRTCHEITVKLDRLDDSPLVERIKRLGTATPGRDHEFLAQATVVKGIIQHISDAPDRDRDAFMRGREPAQPSRKEQERLVFRKSFLDENDSTIYESVRNLFAAVATQWPSAWSGEGAGVMLPRTNGYLALMRYLRDATLYWVGPNKVVSEDQHRQIFQATGLRDEDFNTINFKPGTSGEAALYRKLAEAIPS